MFQEVRMRSRCLLLAGCALLALTAAGAAGERVPALARFRLDDPHSPTFYVRYQDHTLRIARSFEGLGKARPVRLLRTRTYHDTHDHLFYRDREYAPLEIAGPIGSFTSVRVDPVVTVLLDEKRGKPAGPEGDFDFTPTLHFLYRDKSGVTWDYVCFDEASLVDTNLLEKTELVEAVVPDPRRLNLDLYAVAEGDRIGVSLEAMSGQKLLLHVQRNGKAFPVRLAITDAAGKVVRSTAGDIWEFRHHGNTEAYYAAVPKGTYTVTATIGRTPFAGLLSTSQQVEVK